MSVIAAGTAGNPDAAVASLTAGDYELTVSVDGRSRAKPKREIDGHLMLKDLRPPRKFGGSVYRLYGWTDVDFKSLGASISASDTAPDSRDPENPGVLVWESSPAFANAIKSLERRKIALLPGAPVLLIGTVENKRATRDMEDGGGIGLFVEAIQSSCLLGRWGAFGLVRGAEGHFRLCPSVGAPPLKRDPLRVPN